MFPTQDSGEEGNDEDFLGVEFSFQGGALREDWNSGEVEASWFERDGLDSNAFTAAMSINGGIVVPFCTVFHFDSRHSI